MNDEERTQQEAIHDAIVASLPLEEDEFVTGWVVLYETTSSEVATAGHFYGPSGMTTWRAMGLLEWGKYTLHPDTEGNT